MIYRILRLLILCLPYWLVIQVYKIKKSLPANIHTRTGKVFKAVMVTEKYGLLFSEKDYIKNRVKLLRERQKSLDTAYEEIAREMNSLSTESREMFFNEEKE